MVFSVQKLSIRGLVLPQLLENSQVTLMEEWRGWCATFTIWSTTAHPTPPIIRTAHKSQLGIFWYFISNSDIDHIGLLQYTVIVLLKKLLVLLLVKNHHLPDAETNRASNPSGTYTFRFLSSVRVLIKQWYRSDRFVAIYGYYFTVEISSMYFCL